jgi:tetratricopeptide (TPR) repeat protein
VAGLAVLGAVHQATGKLDLAIQYFEKSLQHSRELGDHLSEGLILSNLSLIYSLKEDYSASGHAAEKSYVAFQTIGDEVQQPLPLRMMGYSAINSGNVVRARALIRESLKGNYSRDHLPGQLACLIAIGMCDLAQNNAERAVTYAALVENRVNADAIPLLEPDTLALQKLISDAKNKLSENSFKQIIERSKRLRAEELIASELPAAV